LYVVVSENFDDHGKFWLKAPILKWLDRIQIMKLDPDPGSKVSGDPSGWDA